MSTNKKSPVNQAIRDAYINAFNAQDADKIAQLLSDQAVMEIIGVTEEYGKEMIRSNSLTDWEKDEEETHGYFDYLDGKAAFFVYAKDEQGLAVLHTVQVIEHDQEQIFFNQGLLLLSGIHCFRCRNYKPFPKNIRSFLDMKKRRAGFPPALLFLYLQAMPTIKKSTTNTLQLIDPRSIRALLYIM